MRVKQQPRGLHEGDLGITPAHAGKTDYEAQYEMTTEDHPRACG